MRKNTRKKISQLLSKHKDTFYKIALDVVNQNETVDNGCKELSNLTSFIKSNLERIIHYPYSAFEAKRRYRLYFSNILSDNCSLDDSDTPGLFVKTYLSILINICIVLMTQDISWDEIFNSFKKNVDNPEVIVYN